MKKFLPLILAVPVFLISLLMLRPEATTPVIVAGRDLPEHSTLAASDIEISQVPKSLAPPASFSDPAQVVGKTLSVFRGAGDVIHPANLGGETLRLAAFERAIAIHVTDSAGLAGLIRPGDTVGVTAVMDGYDGSFAKTVASGLRVLYISPEFKAVQGVVQNAGQPGPNSPFSGSPGTLSRGDRDQEGTVVLAVPVEAITIGYDFSNFGVTSASLLASLTDLLPALDQVDTVRLSLFLEPEKPDPFLTSGLFLPDLVITPLPSPTAAPCTGAACLQPTPTSTVKAP